MQVVKIEVKADGYRNGSWHTMRSAEMACNMATSLVQSSHGNASIRTTFIDRSGVRRVRISTYS